MKIEEYGLLFQPLFFQSDPFTKLETCLSFIKENKAANTQTYQMGVKVIWNGKTSGWLGIKFLQDNVYIRMSSDRLTSNDPLFLEKLAENLPLMQDHGIMKMGVIIL